MQALISSNQRGGSNLGWLQSQHTFSFGSYYNPQRMGYGPLRVINEDRVAPGAGFHEHGHNDMEILSWVLEGGLAHQDSLGHGATIRPGELQRMSAGTGIQHAEFNASETAPVHFLQIWIMPDTRSVTPGYAQKDFSAALGSHWTLLASRDGRDGSISIHQDVDLHVARPVAGTQLDYSAAAGRRLYLHIARGSAVVGGQRLVAGDALAIEQEALHIEATEASEWLLFDLPPVRTA